MKLICLVLESRQVKKNIRINGINKSGGRKEQRMNN